MQCVGLKEVLMSLVDIAVQYDASILHLYSQAVDATCRLLNRECVMSESCWMDGWISWMHACMGGWMEGGREGRTDGQTHGRAHLQTDRWTSESMNDSMNE